MREYTSATMKTLIATRLAELHATRTANGRTGHAPPLAECLDAAREGRLWDVDTQSAGHDCLVIADDAESALAEVAAYAEPDLAPAHPDGAAGWAVARRWTAEPVRLAPPRLADLSPRDVGREDWEGPEAPTCWALVDTYYRIRHVGERGANAYHVGPAANIFEEKDAAIEAARSLDDLGDEWDVEVVEFSYVTGSGRVVWGY